MMGKCTLGECNDVIMARASKRETYNISIGAF